MNIMNRSTQKSQFSGFIRFVACFTAMCFIFVFTIGDLSYALGGGSSASQGNPASAQLGELAQSAGPAQSFQADLFTGRGQTGIPIFVPPGRKNIQPSLNLSYSSSGGNSWLGMGWNLDMGFIQRDVKKGVPKYDSTDKYIFSFQGVSSELVNVATNEYRAKDEALFLKFMYDSTNNKWTVTDKSGTEYTFGDNSSTRQTNSSGTFKWALAKVKDTSGNYMTISYTTDSGELYLSTVEYNGNETQSFAHTHKVEFTLEDRDDDSFSYITGARVELKKRLQQIQVKVKDSQGTYQLARKYSLGYEYSTATKRSRLISVTEYGKDGTTSLPVTTFTYQDKPLEFDSMADFSGISRATSSTNYDFLRYTTASSETVVDLLDVNGDGFNDRVQAVSANTAWKVQLNNGSSFASLSDFGTLYKPTSWSGWDYISRVDDNKQQASDFLDINGDGLPDRILAQDNNTAWIVQLNTGSGFDSNNSSWGTISRMVSSSVSYDYIRYSPGTDPTVTWIDFFDINGDGLPDRIMAEENNSTWKVQLNTGSGFSSMQDWGTTEEMETSSKRDAIRLTSSARETKVDMVDINGDGLPDRVQSKDSNTYWKVQYNTGSGFTTMQDFGPIEVLNSNPRWEHVRYFSDAGEQAVDLFDVNGDGLPDRIQATDNNTAWKVQYNTGTGFTSMQDYGTIGYMVSSVRWSYPRWVNTSGEMAVDVADLDGDGLADRLQSNDSNTAWKKQKNKGPYPDLLKEIKNGRGGKTTITYTASTAFDNTDTNGKQRLPFPIQVVTQIDQADGMGNTYTTTYSYKGGMYDSTEREFRGFREVTVTDAIGTKYIHTYGQDDHNKGKLLEKEVRDSSNNLFSKEVNTYDDTHPYTGVHFVFLSQVDSYIYDGDATYKQIRREYTYDSYGNIASTIERGDIGVSGDERKAVNEYVYNTTDYILNTLKKTTLYDSDLTTVRIEKYFYYDAATSIATAPVKGLLTKQEEWLSTASGCGMPGVCTNNPKTTMTYDSYGNLATATDARGYTTTNTFDSTYHLFLTQISTPLSQTSQFTYDPWLGQILTSTDQNGQVMETVFDTLGRVTKVIGALDSNSEPTQEFSYEYPNLATCGSTCVTKTTIKVKASVPGQTFTQSITYSFTDGLGREIQRRSPAEDSSQQIVSGTVEFNNRGAVSKQYVPYFATSGTSYVVPDTSKPKATFTYDAIGRRIRTDYPDGTNSQAVLSDFVSTMTDQRGKQLRHTKDGNGRLIKVEEFNAGSTYTTTYEYDVKDNLIKTTDNAGNQTTITYDSLSRKTGMTDPDMGTWSYVYDLNGNLTSQTDAKSQTISFTYDALNRPTLKDLPSGETDVTYSYDSAPTTYSGQTGYWVGRLAKVTDASGTHEFKYDKLGRIIDDTKTVNSVAYSFARTYDSMGRVRTLTYPDNEVVTYTYNGFGDVEAISGLKNSVTTDYVKEVSYNAAGQITFLKYGNNVTTDYTYNADTLRLSNILTKKPDGTTKLQELGYTFDGNGNVTQITDTINSMSQTFTYDDLNRLTQAIGSAYGTQVFAYDSLGNMTSKAGRSMAYGEGAPGPHAVTSVTWSGNNFPTFCRDLGPGNCTLGYDANGNMITRGQDILTYDSENRLTEMKVREGESGATNYTLKPGWNVISFTHLPDNRSVSNILSSLTFGADYDQVSYWDAAAAGTDKWKHWVNDSDFNDFTQFEYGKTYEIYNKAGVDKTLSVTGKTSGTDVTHNIVSGDNFISPAVKTATNVATVLSTLTQGTHYSDVKRFNASTQTWESYQGGAFTQFEPGKGYNIIGLTSASFSYGKTETTTTFVYDSVGSRIKKTAGGTTTIYLGKDYEVEGATSTKYVFFGDRRITTKKSNGDIFFTHTDHINSTNVVTDSSGNQSMLLEYDPYGETATFTGSADLKHKFTGQEKDDSTRLYFYAWRYYDSQLGRFIMPDTIVPEAFNPQDLNRYSYVNNNPIKYTDPTGHKGFWKKFWKAFVGAAVGALITVLTFGAGAPLWVAGMIGGIIGGATSGALNGGLKGALLGASIGGALGAVGGWGVENFGWQFGVAMLAGAVAVAAATKDWGSFAGGLAGAYVGSQVGSGINSAMHDGISVQGKDGGTIKALGVGTTDEKALQALRVSSSKGVSAVVYVRSRGLLADLVRAGISKVFNNTLASRQFADYIKAHPHASWDVHSEMTILAKNAAELLKGDGFTNVGGTFKLYSPFYSQAHADKVFLGIGARAQWNPPNYFDSSGLFAYASSNPTRAVVSGVAGLATAEIAHGRKFYD
ncbi:MAG: hypothetical protein A2036_04275 [Omnitrophica bacterium GWA2_50_21]|nr:MAG: hypothetical protein A2036_04275 [Omnitrophica bacterium GWA2_50_21]